MRLHRGDNSQRPRSRVSGAPGRYRRHVDACAGSLILHEDGTTAGCSEDDELEGCRGRELRHEGEPKLCWRWRGGDCNRCGIHIEA